MSEKNECRAVRPCGHQIDEHSVYGCADGCGCAWVPQSVAEPEPGGEPPFVAASGVQPDTRPEGGWRLDGDVPKRVHAARPVPDTGFVPSTCIVCSHASHTEVCHCGCEATVITDWRVVPDTGRRERYAAAIGATDIHNAHVIRLAADAALAVADEEQRDLRLELERRTLMLHGSRGEVTRLRAELDLARAIPSHVWQVWCEDGPVHGFYATEGDAKQGSIDCWQETEPSCPDYSWAKDGPRLELLVGGVRGGVYISRLPVYGRHLTATAPGGQAEDGAQQK